MTISNSESLDADPEVVEQLVDYDETNLRYLVLGGLSLDKLILFNYQLNLGRFNLIARYKAKQREKLVGGLYEDVYSMDSDTLLKTMKSVTKQVSKRQRGLDDAKAEVAQVLTDQPPVTEVS